MTSLTAFPADSGMLYQIHGVEGDQGQLSEVDLVDRSFNDIGSNAGFKINATAFRAEDGIRDQPRSRGLGDVYKRQDLSLLKA